MTVTLDAIIVLYVPARVGDVLCAALWWQNKQEGRITGWKGKSRRREKRRTNENSGRSQKKLKSVDQSEWITNARKQCTMSGDTQRSMGDEECLP